MKLTHLLAAGLLFAGLGVSTAASAQNSDRGDGYSQRDRDRGDYRDDRRDHRDNDRRDYRDGRHDNGRHYGWDNRRNHRWNRHNRHCRVVWRHHHRVRICR